MIHRAASDRLAAYGKAARTLAGVTAAALPAAATADVHVYYGPAIPLELDGFSGAVTLSLDGLDAVMSFDLSQSHHGSHAWTDYVCCDGTQVVDCPGGYGSWTDTSWGLSRTLEDQLRLECGSGLEGVDLLGAKQSTFDGGGGCFEEISLCFWNATSGNGCAGYQSSYDDDACEEYRRYLLGFVATVDGGEVNGWMRVEGTAWQLAVTAWAYEDSGGPIAVGETYCEADGDQVDFEYIKRVQIPEIDFDQESGSDGYADYTEDDPIVLTAGGTYTIKVENGDPQWKNDLFGVFIDWNGDWDFNDDGEFVGVDPGVGPYSVTVNVPEDQAPGRTRMRLRLHDVDINPMTPCDTANFGEVQDHLIEVVAPEPACPGDVNADGEVTAADLGLLIGAWNTDLAAADLNDDGTVNAADLGLLIGAWGVCP